MMLRLLIDKSRANYLIRSFTKQYPSLVNYNELKTPSKVCTTVQASTPSTAQILKSLAKFNLTNFVVLSSMCGYALGASTVSEAIPFCDNLLAFSFLSTGTWLTSASANCFNQISERDFDKNMIRTQARVLVRKIISPETAKIIATSWGVGGISLLYFGCNPTVALLGFSNLLLYTSVYTPMKRVHEVNTWIGSVVGGIPPLMGWCAATGGLEWGSLLLAFLLYSWQFPHFMALSWMAKNDYNKAGYKMTSIASSSRCKSVAMRHSILTALISISGIGCKAAYIGPWAGAAMGVTALPANIALIYTSYLFYISKDSEANQAARKLFFTTLVHLPVVMSCFLTVTYWNEIANSVSYFI